MEVPTLTIFCREGRPPADDIFAYWGCPQPVPARSPCPGPGPAEETRAAARAGQAAHRRDRGGDRGVAVVRRDRAVGRGCRPGGAGRAGRGVRPCGGVHLPARLCPGQPGCARPVLGAWLWTRSVRVSGRLVIAIDGKTVRGAKDKEEKAPHLVAALAHGIGA